MNKNISKFVGWFNMILGGIGSLIWLFLLVKFLFAIFATPANTGYSGWARFANFLTAAFLLPFIELLFFSPVILCSGLSYLNSKKGARLLGILGAFLSVITAILSMYENRQFQLSPFFGGMELGFFITTFVLLVNIIAVIFIKKDNAVSLSTKKSILENLSRIFIIIWILIGVIGIGLKTYSVSPINKSKRYPNGNLKIEYLYSSGDVMTVKEYYENGKIKLISRRKTNKLDGVSEKYYENGQLQETATYAQGQLNGIRNNYYENGKLEAIMNFNMGKEVAGSYAHYTKNGQQDSVLSENEEGLRPYKRYYDNGQLMTDGFINKDGRNEGQWKEYYKNGGIESVSGYKNGKLDGVSEEYYENGQLHKTATYAQGQLNGEYKTYYEDGRLKSVMNFNMGKEALDSYYRHYTKTGQQDEIKSPANEQGLRLHRQYYDNGQLMTDGFLDKNGLRQGLWKEYNRDDGRLTFEWCWKDGRSGERSAYNYNDNGSLVSKPRVLNCQ